MTSPFIASFPSSSKIKKCMPMAGVVKAAGASGVSKVQVIYAPAISVPPQYSMTGLLFARDIRYCMSLALEHSAVDVNNLSDDQLTVSMHFVLRQLFTKVGTTPTCVIFAVSINFP